MFAGGSPNLYSYSMNDPINFIDPSGKIFVADDAVGVVIGIGAVGGAVAIANGFVAYSNTHSFSTALSAAASGFESGALAAATAVLTEGAGSLISIFASTVVDLGVSSLTAPTVLAPNSGQDFMNGVTSLTNPRNSCGH